MRPVNLIPAESRRGDSAPTRSGPLAYAIVGLLVVGLGVMVALTMFGNQIEESQAEIKDLEPKIEQTRARAVSLAPYVSLEQIREARTLTIDTLAKSRFDWERVLRELSRLVPSNVALTNVTGTIAPGVQVTGAAGIGLRGSVAGPALELVGCSPGQRPIAELISQLYDIDGVTRVTAENGVRGEDAEASGLCSKGTYSEFQVVAAFDSVVVPAATAPAPAAAPVPAATTEPPVGAAETDTGSAAAQSEIDNAAQSVDNASGLAP